MTTDLVVTDQFIPLAELEKAGALTATGLDLPPGLSYEEYEAIGRGLFLAQEAIQFAVGDWLNYGEREYQHDIYVQAAHMTGAADQTLQNWKHIAKALPPQRRQPVWLVKYSIQAEVAKNGLPAADQRRILKQAAEEGMTKTQVRDLVREAKGEPDPPIVEPAVCGECGRPI